MPLVSQSTPSYKGGVSQQPDIVRYPDQVAELINGFPNEAEGLQKRPPTLHIARLGDTIDASTVKYHMINRDDKEQYLLEMSNGNLRVWDLLGNEKQVKYPNGKDYLTVKDAKNDFRAVTVADYTFILNRNVECKLDSKVDSYNYDNTALCYVKAVNYAKTFAIYINDEFAVGVITPDGGEPKQAVGTTTSVVTKRLKELMEGTLAEFTTYEQLVELLGGTATLRMARNPSFNWQDYTVKVHGDSVLSIQRKDKGRFKLTSKDGFGNQNMITVAGYVKDLSKLPPIAPDGYIVQVKGEARSENDDYYVKWDDKKILWLECTKPHLQNFIKSTTMPHALVREADGSFSFKTLEWVDRRTGDEDTNPEPTFLDNTINDIFFYRNRLGFVSDENIILSESGGFFNFWYKSATTVTDTDPIDVSVSSNKVSILTHAVPFARELMLFSREGQFVLSSDGVMTPKTVKVDQITAFDYSDSVQPISLGYNIFFINNKVNYASLMRYFTVQDVAELKDAEDVTAHVPTYMPVGVTQISGNTTDNTLLMTSSTEANTVWMYKFLFNGDQPLQQAWGKWRFAYKGADVCAVNFVDAEIYLVINTDGGLFLEKTHLTGNVSDFTDEPTRLFMDRKIEYTIPDSGYDSFNDKTTISLKTMYGSVPNKGYKYFMITTDGYLTEIEDWDSDGNFLVRGDYRNLKVYVGRQYEFRVKLSKQLIKSATQTGAVSDDGGRLQLRYQYVNYSDTGVFKAIVENPSKKSHYEYLCTSRYLTTNRIILGKVSLNTDTFRFPVQDNAVEAEISYVSDDPLAINLLSGGWEGMYTRRTKKV